MIKTNENICMQRNANTCKNTDKKKQIRMSDSNTGILGKSPNICSD